jgi:hypothetical protein
MEGIGFFSTIFGSFKSVLCSNVPTTTQLPFIHSRNTAHSNPYMYGFYILSLVTNLLITGLTGQYFISLASLARYCCAFELTLELPSWTDHQLNQTRKAHPRRSYCKTVQHDGAYDVRCSWHPFYMCLYSIRLQSRIRDDL